MEPGVIGSIKGNPAHVITVEDRLQQRKTNAENVKHRKDAILVERHEKLEVLLKHQEEKNKVFLRNREEKARREKNKYLKTLNKSKKTSPARSRKVRSNVSKKKEVVVLNPLGFNVKTKRFQHLGLHPALDPLGCLSKDPNIGPGTYDPEKLRSHVYAVDYAKSNKSSDFSNTLGYKVPSMLTERSWLKGSLGPATYNPYDSSYDTTTPGVLRDKGFSTCDRFPKIGGSKTPGPGSYGKNHIPHTLREENNSVTRTWTHVPSFEWSVGRSIVSQRKYHLPPNLYDCKDPGSITEKVLHSVSKRGPYDVFTGPRDSSTITSYFASPKFKGSKTWPYELPDTNQLRKSKNGKWVGGARFEHHRDNMSPSPAEYNPKFPECHAKIRSRHPFNCSTANVRPPPPYKLQPGVGRYNAVHEAYVNGHQNVFKSRDVRSQWMYPERFNDF